MKSKSDYSYIIFILLLIVAVSSGVSFSRYTSTLGNDGDASTSIIVNKYNLSATWEMKNFADQYPQMETQSYEFKIENTELTDLDYSLEILMKWSDAVDGLKFPMHMRLYKFDPEEPDDDGQLIATKPPGNATFNSINTAKEIIAGKQKIGFRLEWDWATGSAYREYRYADRAIDVKIDVNGEQRSIDLE